MATKQEIIYDILTIAKKGNITDDDLLNETYIGYKVDEKRAKEIHDSYKRNFMIDPKWVQDYGLVETTEVNQADTTFFQNAWDAEFVDCKFSKITLPPTVYIQNNISAANNLSVVSIRSADNLREFYFKTLNQLMEVYNLSENHPAKKFGYYTQIGNSIYIMNGPKTIRPYLILEKPLDGYIISTENIGQSSLIIGNTYQVIDKHITHNGKLYQINSFFVATNENWIGPGQIKLVNNKRKMTVWDEYPMSSTMIEVVIMKILMQDFKLSTQMITDLRNDSKDSLKVLQPINE